VDANKKDDRLMQLAVDIQRSGVTLREARCAKVTTTETDDGKNTVYTLKVKPIVGEPEISIRVRSDLGEWKTKKGDEWLLVLKKHSTQKALNE
jgi:hypothetical protein